MREHLSGELNPDRFHSILDLIRFVARQHGNLPAYRCFGHNLTYRQVDELSSRFAHFLQSRTDLQPGDRIAIQLPNLLQFPVALFGAIKAGLIVVNTNPLYTTREMRHQFKDSGVRAIVILENFCDKLEAILPETEIQSVFITRIGDLLPALSRLKLNWGIRYLKRAVPRYTLAGSRLLQAAIEAGDAGKVAESTRSRNDVALILYTGGTTGYAKGVMLTHHNLIANMMQLRSRCLAIIHDRDDVILAPLPLYHSYAFLFHCLVMPLGGNCNVLIPNPRDLGSLFDTLRETPVQGMVGINTLFQSLLHHPRFNPAWFAGLRFSGAGGMPLNPKVATDWEQATGCEIFEGYGLTECSPVVSVNPPGRNKPGTVGPVVPDTEVQVVDDAGRIVAGGERGELWVRGPQVMKGYWNNPGDTDKVLTPDGWFKTGDYVQIDGEGYIRIVDRKKDMILVSGFNVVPSEIEEYVNTHPAVLESAAIGVPSEETGEGIILYVTPRSKDLSQDQLLAFCRQGLAGYKLPREIRFTESLPKSNVGKILRRELRERYAAHH